MTLDFPEQLESWTTVAGLKDLYHLVLARKVWYDVPPFPPNLTLRDNPFSTVLLL